MISNFSFWLTFFYLWSISNISGSHSAQYESKLSNVLIRNFGILDVEVITDFEFRNIYRKTQFLHVQEPIFHFPYGERIFFGSFSLRKIQTEF